MEEMSINVNELKKLFRLALDGQLTYEQLEQMQKNKRNDEPYRTLFEDLEEAVQHTPFFFILKKGIDEVTWRGMYEYHVILCDYELLHLLSNYPPQDWLVLRQQLISSTKGLADLDERVLQDKIKQLVNEFDIDSTD